MSSAPAAAQADAIVSAPSPARAGLLPWIALAALALLQATLILTHAPWRDELQSAMLARHSGSLADLFANIHYEGSPALWFVLLRALAPLGSAPEVLKAVQLAIAFATIAVVWTRAPFDAWTRLLILTSYLILFEWGVIARSYGLGMALYFAFLALSRTRPLAACLVLGLVANVAAHFLLLAGASALLLFLTSEKRPWTGTALFAALALIAVATAWPAGNVYPPGTLAPGLLSRIGDALGSISATLIPVDPRIIPPFWKELTLPAALVVGALAVPLGAIALLRNRSATGAFLTLAAAVFAFSFFVYPAHARHVGVIFLFLVGAEWMLAERGFGPISLISRSWIAVMAASGLWMAAWALVIPFTPMRDVARSIDARGIEQAQWAVYPSFMGVEISARLNRPYYDVQQQCLAWFEGWNAAFIRSVRPPELDARLAAAASAVGGRMYFLAQQDYGDDAPHLTLVEKFSPGLLAEQLRIYEVNAPADSAASPLPACR